jgi:hypothetical protein
MRLNPEHPPLLKDLASLPLLFLKLNFPSSHPSWVQKEPPAWWHQFDFAGEFLYRAGNNPDKILFWSRLVMILLSVFFGWFLFFWSRRLFGDAAALLSLFFFSFSPTILAHGRLVTTDVGAAFGAAFATFFWLKFLENPMRKNIILAGLSFGIAMLVKFSLILLLPFFAILTFVWAILEKKESILKNIFRYLKYASVAGFIGLIFVILPVYLWHVWNYPMDQQIRDTRFLLENSIIPAPLASFAVWLAKIPVLRALGEYFLGLMLVINRGATGHTTYFLGEISAEGFRAYFPVVYLIKEPLPFHIVTLLAIASAMLAARKYFGGRNASLKVKVNEWIGGNFAVFAMLVFIGIYSMASITSKLNIGVRHLLPIFPFVILLTSAGVSRLLLKEPFLKIKYLLLGILLIWQAVSVLKVYPHFLAYFNEIASGPGGGYRWVVDSNLDWGQDLKRLKNWMDENAIEKIYLDYFGGGNAAYYLKGKFEPWWGKRNPAELPEGSYLAVSVSQLQGGTGKARKDYKGETGYYRWLSQYQPIANIGYSIFVYKIDWKP